MKVPKVVKLTNKKKTLGTSVINSLMSPPSLRYIKGEIFSLQIVKDLKENITFFVCILQYNALTYINNENKMTMMECI